jgi:hypothetical protein
MTSFVNEKAFLERVRASKREHYVVPTRDEAYTLCRMLNDSENERIQYGTTNL